MKPSAQSLALRDPAMAAIYGLGGQADFGADLADYRSPVWESRHDANALAERGQFGTAARLDSDASAIQMEERLARHLRQQQSRTEERLALLDPNAGSSVKIGHYTFSVQQTVVLSAAEGLSMTNSPLTDIKPERLIFNVPCFQFALISVVQIGNTSVIIGGSEDAANYTNVAVDVKLSMPLLRTSSRALVGGEYTGLSPAPFTPGNEYTIIATFHGPAMMTT